jgi:hypothetical protein
MKTNELTGAALNWAVGVAEGIQWESDDTEVGLYHRRSRYDRLVLGALDYDIMEDWGLTPYEPSTNWSQGGPIIEREGISVDRTGLAWTADISDSVGGYIEHTESGPTPLVAAMRCYVASKLGDEIQIPKELL